MRGCLVPSLGPAVVEAQSQVVRPEIVTMQRLERLGYTSMQQSAAWRKELAVSALANPLVGEVEALAEPVKDPPPHQLLHRLSGFVFPEARCALHQREVE